MVYDIHNTIGGTPGTRYNMDVPERKSSVPPCNRKSVAPIIVT